MIVNEWIEPYTLMMGVHSMGVITEVLCTSGLVYAPFFVAIAKSIVEAMTQGEDEGNAGELAVKFLRKELLMIFPVFIIAFVPMTNSDMRFDVQISNYACDGAQRAQEKPTPNQQMMMGNFQGGYTKIPVWWLIVHDYASTFTNTVIASTPCAADLQMASVNIQSANLENSFDQAIADSWQRACLSPAVGDATRKGTLDDKTWAGSQSLRKYYQQEQNTVLISRESALAAGLPIGEMDGSQVRLNCDVAYQHIEQAAVTAAKNQSKDSLNLLVSASSDAEAEKKMAMAKVAKVQPQAEAQIKALLSGAPEQQKGPDSVSSYVKELVGWLGTAVGNLMKAPGTVVLKNTTPIIVCVMQMTLLMVIPILLVFSGFNMKTALALSAMYFGLEFTLVFVNLATWMDNTLNLFFYSSISGELAGGSTTFITGLQDSILTRVGYTSYDLLPKLWMGLMAYVGIKGGGQMIGAASQGVESSVTSGVSSGVRGANIADSTMKSAGRAFMGPGGKA
jgi:hypothetical protein